MMTEHAPGEAGPGARPEAAHGGHLVTAGQHRRERGMRRWARAGLIAQIAFVASWLIAATWQGPRYSTTAHSISDMYAMTAPGAAFLIVVFTLCGAATIVFAIWSVRRALRPGGWTATAGSVLLALSVVGLGDLLTATERLACRMADPGCTATKQIANVGGQLDNSLTTGGVLAFVLAGLLLSFAMRRAAGWRRHSAADPEGPAGRIRDGCHSLTAVSPRKARRLPAEVRRRPRGGAGRPDPAGGGARDGRPGGAGESPVVRLGPPQTQTWPDGDWVVRQVPGAAATKTYRCPGCDQEIRPGVPHVVVWPAQTPGPAQRRHWHNSCWQRRPRRPGPGARTRR